MFFLEVVCSQDLITRQLDQDQIFPDFSLIIILLDFKNNWNLDNPILIPNVTWLQTVTLHTIQIQHVHG